MAELLYGFHQLKDILGQPVNESNLPKINTAIRATVAEYNRQLDAIVGLFVRDVSSYKLRYKSPLIKRLQPLDENGRARPTKGAGYYDVAFPIQSAGDAWGTNYVTSQKMTVQDINDWMDSTLIADRRWVSDHILAALYNKDGWTYPDEDHGDLSILGLANGDSQEYLIKIGSGAGATDNHYLAQTNAIDDANNPFPTIRQELVEHPENGGENAAVIALVPTALMTAVEGLATYRDYGDPDIRLGTDQDTLVGRLNTAVPGLVRGKANNVWIVEWGSMPSDHITAVPVTGEKPLGRRRHAEASLQGLFELPQRSDTPYYERQWQRHEGYGAYNRVGAVDMRIGNASWAVPTNFGSPMA